MLERRSSEFKHDPSSHAGVPRATALSLDASPSSGQPRSVHHSWTTEALNDEKINKIMTHNDDT